MLWLNFLHIYQPPTLDKELLVRITSECYLPLVKILKDHPHYKITLNITACLTEYLHQVGFTKLIDELKLLVERGQIELTGSAAFHPLLPLVPLYEAERQIIVNYEMNRRYFGTAYKPRGFYLPEMAYSPEVGQLIKRLGFEWLILGEIAYDGKINNKHLDYGKKYQIKDNGLCVIFRNRRLSKTFVPETINQLLASSSKPELVITATDGELYGHKYIDPSNIHAEILKNPNLKTATISEFFRRSLPMETISPLSSSWESTPDELKKNIPYGLWNHPKNKIHVKLWQLANFALSLNYHHLSDLNHFASRLHLEKGLASCTFWWASDRDFKLFDRPAWNPEEVEKGALELLRAVRSLVNISSGEKIKAEKMFLEIHRLIWLKHWKKTMTIKR